MFERVYVEMDWHDGHPLEGIADYQGKPHYFVRKFDEASDDYKDHFELQPVDAETLSIAIAKWKIFVAWHDEYESGFAKTDTHPGQPGVNPDYELLEQKFAKRVAAAATTSIRATLTTQNVNVAKRRRYTEAGPDYRVEWTLVEAKGE
ncbi:MAG: hypothetical protein IPK60_15560 [Sandaracinaceae bacterium]|jgi:hypothetical protein|nr:hypothetical protein [Sandaracinaceae bacterium]